MVRYLYEQMYLKLEAKSESESETTKKQSFLFFQYETTMV